MEGRRADACAGSPMADRPSYLKLLESGELGRRVERLIGGLEACDVCPRGCGAPRAADGTDFCRTGRYAEVSSWCLHHGEEPPISGFRGSGTVFFAHCNLECLFCQNHRISQRFPQGSAVHTPEELALIYLSLQQQGAHNINWVSPGHVSPQAVEALAIAAAGGLSIPVVYNSNGYDRVETLELLEDVVDIYMPDLKYADDAVARELSGAPDYVETARAALREMWRQVGPLRTDRDGVAWRGLLVRHLVLPENLSGSAEVLRFLAGDLGRGVTVSLMSQYHPCYMAGTHPQLRRRISRREYGEALRALRAEGLEEGYIQELSSAAIYLPDFDADDPFRR